MYSGRQKLVLGFFDQTNCRTLNLKRKEAIATFIIMNEKTNETFFVKFRRDKTNFRFLIVLTNYTLLITTNIHFTIKY